MNYYFKKRNKIIKFFIFVILGIFIFFSLENSLILDEANKNKLNYEI